MNTDEKKRISISVPLDMIEKIEGINQDEYHGCAKFQHRMLNMIRLGFFAIDYFGGFKYAQAGRLHAAKEREAEPSLPAIIPSHGIVLEFPCGNRPPAG